MKEVVIGCKGAANAALDEFVWFQGDLKTLSDENYEKLKNQILELKFSEPVSVWLDGNEMKLLNGHQRILTLKKMRDEGYRIPHIPYNPVDAENVEEAKRKVLSFTSTFGHLTEVGVAAFIHDTSIDIAELKDDFNLAGLNVDNLPELKAIDVREHTRLVRAIDSDDDADDVKKMESQLETFVNPGELWSLGDHWLLCGDSTKIKDLHKLLKNKKADMLFTDPPYGVNYEGGHFHSGDVNIKNKREKLANDESTDIYPSFLKHIPDIVDGPCYTWFASTRGKCILEAVEAVGELHAMLIWHKINATYAAMNAQYKQRHEPLLYWKPKKSTLRWNGPSDECTVWEEKRDSKNNFHPTQKPVSLAERAIRNHTVETVLDLFGGSGSTLIACENLGKQCYMMEMNPHYCSVIIERWHRLTGKRAELVTS